MHGDSTWVSSGSSDSEGTPDHSMQKVLDATQALSLTPPWTLSPQEARQQPTPADVGYTCYEGVTHEFFGMGLIVKDAAAAQTRVATALKKELSHGAMGKLADALT